MRVEISAGISAMSLSRKKRSLSWVSLMMQGGKVEKLLSSRKSVWSPESSPNQSGNSEILFELMSSSRRCRRFLMHPGRLVNRFSSRKSDLSAVSVENCSGNSPSLFLPTVFLRWKKKERGEKREGKLTIDGNQVPRVEEERWRQ